MTLSEGIWALSPRLCQADHLRKGEIVTDTKSFAGSSSAPPEAHLPEMSKKRRLAEAVAVTGGVFALFWLAPGGRGGVCLVAGVYLLAERRIRRRPWGEFGFDIRGSSSAMKRTWWLVGLVGVVLPVTYTVSAHVWCQSYWITIWAEASWVRGWSRACPCWRWRPWAKRWLPHPAPGAPGLVPALLGGGRGLSTHFRPSPSGRGSGRDRHG